MAMQAGRLPAEVCAHHGGPDRPSMFFGRRPCPKTQPCPPSHAGAGAVTGIARLDCATLVLDCYPNPNPNLDPPPMQARAR